ncbi:MAG: alpha/beta fold hydrolase [Rhodanobacteraceae bacterium]
MTRLPSSAGVSLAVETWGSDRDPGIVFAHGFGQTRDAWAGTAAAIAGKGWRSVAYDARGHGDSDWRGDEPYAWEQLLDDLVAVAGFAGSRPVLVGASMGGLLGLAAEGLRAPLFRALVLVDVTPRWEPAGVDRIMGFMRAHPDGFDSLQHASEAIAAYLPHRGARKSPERLRALLCDHGDGRMRWHWDPRLLDEIAQHSAAQQPLLIEAARRVRIPTLLISGGASDLVSRNTIDEFLALVPHARHVVVPHATHMVAGDDNIVFTRHVLEFLHTLQDEEFYR